MARLRDRPTTDILILMIAGTICFAVLSSGAVIGIAKIINPDSDTSTATNIISDTINTLIGLLAGFLAGRTEATQQQLKDMREIEREQREIEREVRGRIHNEEGGEESP